MIYEFSFGNYRSFKDIQSLNMTAAKINEHNSTNVIAINDKQKLLKSKAIYGANASGKSNIVKALLRFIAIINYSVKDENTLKLYIDNFQLSDTTINEPTFFQLIFQMNGIKYRYGFEATNQDITSEWLFGTPNRKELPYFIRENNYIQGNINEKYFLEGKKLVSFLDADENPIFRNNSLFLTSVASMNGKLSRQILDVISSITVLSGLSIGENLFQKSVSALKDKRFKSKIENFLHYADTGVLSLDVIELTEDNIPMSLQNLQNQKNKNINLLVSNHNVYNSQKKVIEKKNLLFQTSQSEGTKKMFELSYFIIQALQEGRTIVIDEFDARIHPLISKKIVELFNSSTNINSQLIFITHDTNLLNNNLLRRDQIDFVEKDKYGASHLYSLIQFKGVRNNALINSDYIKGKYGAIPFLGNFSKLISDYADE